MPGAVLSWQRDDMLVQALPLYSMLPFLKEKFVPKLAIYILYFTDFTQIKHWLILSFQYYYYKRINDITVYGSLSPVMESPPSHCPCREYLYTLFSFVLYGTILRHIVVHEPRIGPWDSGNNTREVIDGHRLLSMLTLGVILYPDILLGYQAWFRSRNNVEAVYCIGNQSLM